MEYIQAILRKYPNRIKYGLVILDIFAMILAIRTYVNYVSIETAIEDASLQQQIKSDELAFTQNFLIPYEKSAYASYFLQHENNMLLRDEYIVKFEEMYQKQEVNTWTTVDPYMQENINEANSPQESWRKFILEKFNG